MNRDQLLDVPVARTGVKSVDDGEAWPPEFAKYSATTVKTTHSSSQTPVATACALLTAPSLVSASAARSICVAEFRSPNSVVPSLEDRR